MMKKSQISIEYIIIIGFITMVLVIILGIAFFYSSSIKDRIKVIQINNFANKIISVSESVFYYGDPSRATVSVYLPEGVEEIIILDNNIIISMQTSSGMEKTSFKSRVPMEGSFLVSSGIKNIKIESKGDHVEVSSV